MFFWPPVVTGFYHSGARVSFREDNIISKCNRKCVRRVAPLGPSDEDHQWEFVGTQTYTALQAAESPSESSFPPSAWLSFSFCPVSPVWTKWRFCLWCFTPQISVTRPKPGRCTTAGLTVWWRSSSDRWHTHIRRLQDHSLDDNKKSVWSFIIHNHFEVLLKWM